MAAVSTISCSIKYVTHDRLLDHLDRQQPILVVLEHAQKVGVHLQLRVGGVIRAGGGSGRVRGVWQLGFGLGLNQNPLVWAWVLVWALKLVQRRVWGDFGLGFRVEG
jgi:hypothetical protein